MNFVTTLGMQVWVYGEGGGVDPVAWGVLFAGFGFLLSMMFFPKLTLSVVLCNIGHPVIGMLFLFFGSASFFEDERQVRESSAVKRKTHEDRLIEPLENYNIGGRK